MPTYAKIEWSGYWDFPNGTYTTGSKEGDPISGEFAPETIKLDDIGNAEYEIDPGEITIPQSNGWDFTLINRDPATGDQLYPFDELINLGRTEEYGGSFQHFGDLFIRASIPAYNNKVIFKGAAETISYSPHDFEVTIECNSIIDLFKDSERQMFVVHEFGSKEVQSLFAPPNNNLEDSVTGNEQGFIENTENHLGESLQIERIRCEIESTDRIFEAEFAELDKYLEGQDLHHWVTNDNQFSTLNNFLGDPDVRNILFRSYENDLFADRYLSQTPIEVVSEETPASGGDYWMCRGTGNWVTGFIKIEDSTILTQFRIRYRLDLYHHNWDNMNGYVDIRFVDVNKYQLDILHAKNGRVTTHVGGNEKEIYERGRFFKNGDSYDDSVIEEGDTVEISLIDYIHKDPFNINEENNPAIADESFTEIPDGGGLNSPNYYPVHGVIFEVGANNIFVIKPREGYFDNLSALADMINSNFLDSYLSGNIIGGYSIFNVDDIPDNHGRYCFFSDLVHYGWNNNLEDVIVNTGRQVSAYLFENEKGKIVFKPRKRESYSSRSNLLDDAIQILQEDYEITSGFNYSYGSKYYNATYSDRIEINNIEGEEEIDIKVNSSGEIVNTPQKSQEIELANYRTTDLGVPSSGARTGHSNERVLREPPNNLDRFLKGPVSQAITVADGINFPAKMFSISLDVLGGQGNYTNIGIGSIIYINKEDEYEVYLVKKINYSPIRVRNESLSLRLDLLKLFTYREPITDTFSEEIAVNDEIPPVISETYDEEISINDNVNETVS